MSMQVGKSAGVRADINVTPLIDVCLVLLIIFMVITPMLTKGYPVPLPQGIDPAKKPDDKNDIILSVARSREGSRQLYLSVPGGENKSTELSEDAGKQMLADQFAANASAPLYIKADK